MAGGVRFLISWNACISFPANAHFKYSGVARARVFVVVDLQPEFRVWREFKGCLSSDGSSRGGLSGVSGDDNRREFTDGATVSKFNGDAIGS